MVWKSTTQVGCAYQNCSGIFPASYGVCPIFFYILRDDDGDPVCSSRSSTYVNTAHGEMSLGSLREFSSFYLIYNVLIQPIAKTYKPEPEAWKSEVGEHALVCCYFVFIDTSGCIRVCAGLQ
jgi:hypothetical protein